MEKIKRTTNEDYVRKEITIDELLPLYKELKDDYRPCYNCEEYKTSKWGAVWLKHVDVGKPLQAEEASTEIENFFVKTGRKFKLSTYANGTLSVREIKAQLDIWEKTENFVPDVIVIDYADLLVPETKVEFRHQQNEIWKALRGLSQEKHALVITATQADAKSYDTYRLKLGNFSEDKRKLAHVTAMFGLNQDPKDREKKLGLMRINKIIQREGDFSNSDEIYVLQNLRRGRPFIASFGKLKKKLVILFCIISNKTKKSCLQSEKNFNSRQVTS